MSAAGTFRISLTDLRFFAHHGVMEQERRCGNEFRVNLSVCIAVPSTDGEVALEQTVSYADLYEIVKAQMALPQALLENVALAIAREITDRWSIVSGGSVEIVKITPPIAGCTGSASVEYSF